MLSIFLSSQLQEFGPNTNYPALDSGILQTSFHPTFTKWRAAWGHDRLISRAEQEFCAPGGVGVRRDARMWADQAAYSPHPGRETSFPARVTLCSTDRQGLPA